MSKESQITRRGFLKQALIKREFPVEDLAGYEDGKPIPIGLRQTALSGEPFALSLPPSPV